MLRRQRFVALIASTCCLACCLSMAQGFSLSGGFTFGDASRSQSRSYHYSRRFVLEDLQPVPARGTCRLAWYTPATPTFGNTVLCSGSSDTCLQPCSNGYEKLAGTSLCVQQCPDRSAGPHHLCPISRTCIRADGLCPMLTDVPYTCTARDQYLGSCAKQAYVALLAARKVDIECSNGLIFKDHTGGWRCAEGPDLNPCAVGFSNGTAAVPGIGISCKQECPPWLVDCGESCNMPGVPCNTKPEYLCPVAPLTACDMNERASAALQTACQAEGFKSSAVGCPMSLVMHGGCGGAQLQVAAGMHGRGSVSKIEAWWGPIDGGQQNEDDPIRAMRITFANDIQPVVFGNESFTYATSPQTTFSLDSSELVVGSRMWTSTTVMDGARLTPVLAGFSLFTSTKRTLVVGNEQGQWATMETGVQATEGQPSSLPQQEQPWVPTISLTSDNVGMGLPVGAAAFISSNGIHAFGLLYLSVVPRQEL